MPRQKYKTARIHNTFSPNSLQFSSSRIFCLTLAKVVKSSVIAYLVKSANLRVLSIFFSKHCLKEECLLRKYTAFGPLVIVKVGWFQFTDTPGFKPSHLGWTGPRIISSHWLSDLLLAVQQATLLRCHQLNTEWLRSEGTSTIMKLPPLCCRQGHQPSHLILDQAAQGTIQHGLEHLQGWGIHSLSGQPGSKA